MAIDYDRLMARHFAPVEATYTRRDTMLYALGLGYGADPMDGEQLRFVYEDHLQAVPSMGAVLATPGFWAREPDTGIDWKMVVHGEQGLVLHRPLPVTGTVVGQTRIDAIVDKGAGRGALGYTTKELRDKATGELLCESKSTAFWRGDGGFGGPTGPTPAPHRLPERASDAALEIATAAGQALLYRLNGDYNPLHADPAVATAAGFARPILHGLCTYGIACRSILRLACGNDAARLKRMNARFTAPVTPGETIRTEIWDDGGGRLSFRATVVERDRVVLGNGYAEVASG